MPLKNHYDKNIDVVSQKSEPELTVEIFMNHISEDNIEEANKFIISDEEQSKHIDSTREVTPKFDQAAVFKERKLALKKIESNEITEDTAKVKAVVIQNNDSRISIITIFSLKKINDKWFIYDIDFQAGKN